MNRITNIIISNNNNGFLDLEKQAILTAGGRISSNNKKAWIININKAISKINNFNVERFIPFYIIKSSLSKPILITKNNVFLYKDVINSNTYTFIEAVKQIASRKILPSSVFAVINDNGLCNEVLRYSPELEPLSGCSKEQLINGLNKL